MRIFKYKYLVYKKYLNLLNNIKLPFYNRKLKISNFYNILNKNYIPIISNKEDNKKKIESEILQKLYDKGFKNVKSMDVIIASNKEDRVYFKLVTNGKLYKSIGLVTYYEINYNNHIIHFSSGDIYNDNDINSKFNILYI
jgi:hypothetical protein